MASVYCVNNTNLLQEVINDEIIMIDLASKKYYTMNKSGLFIWLLLQQGCGLPAIVKLVAKQCNVASRSIKEPVKAFINHLLSEKLIVKKDMTSEVTPSVPAMLLAGFIGPILHIFHDMDMISANILQNSATG